MTNPEHTGQSKFRYGPKPPSNSLLWRDHAKRVELKLRIAEEDKKTMQAEIDSLRFQLSKNPGEFAGEGERVRRCPDCYGHLAEWVDHDGHMLCSFCGRHFPPTAPKPAAGGEQITPAVAALPPGQEQEERWLRQAAQAALRSTGRCEWRGGGVDRHPNATFDAIEVHMVMREMRQFFNAAINEAKDECHRHEDERLAALRKRVAEGEKDTKRLDWLQSSTRTRTSNNDRGQFEVSTFFVDYDHARKIGGRYEFTRNKLRDAIDAAMAAQESKA